MEKSNESFLTKWNTEANLNLQLNLYFYLVPKVCSILIGLVWLKVYKSYMQRIEVQTLCPRTNLFVTCLT